MDGLKPGISIAIIRLLNTVTKGYLLNDSFAVAFTYIQLSHYLRVAKVPELGKESRETEQKMNTFISRSHVVVLSLVTAVGITLAPQAVAQINPAGAIVGGLIGGAIGHGVGGRHSGGTAIGAAVGAVVGSQIGNPYRPTYGYSYGYNQQYAYSQPVVYDSPVVYRQPYAYGPPVVYSAPVFYSQPYPYYGSPVVYRYRGARRSNYGGGHHGHWAR